MSRYIANVLPCFHLRAWSTLVLITIGVSACSAPAVVSPVPGSQTARPPRQRVVSALPAIHFTIQVGAFSTTERAARYAVKLRADGLDAYYFVDIDGLFKVRFERFASKPAARHRAQALKDQGRIHQFYIVQPSAAGDTIDARAALQSNIVQTAHRFIGTPYRWGGASLQNGFDCSGLTMTVYRLNGLELPRNSRYQFRTGTQVSRGALQKGDLVFFATNGKGRVSHVGIYAGRDQFIHAPGKGKRIRTASLSDTYFRSRYMGARRYF